MKKYIVLVGIYFCLVSSTEAATMRLVPNATHLAVGDEVVVTMEATTNERANAIEGFLTYPEQQLRLVRIDDVGSAVSLWISRPLGREPGEISFMGITPGGFVGSQLPLFRARFEVIAPGTMTVSVGGIQLLAHTSTADDIPVTSSSATMQATVETAPLVVDRPVVDTYPPEVFTPQIVQDSDLHNGQMVLIFETSDQGSGVSAYYVKEYIVPGLRMFTRWQLANSPYVLKHQDRSRYIDVLAVDYTGNERLITVLPEKETSLVRWYVLLVVLFSICLFVWYRTQRKQRINLKSQ